MVAYTERGYRNLVRLATTTQRRFWYRPRIDFADFAEMSEDGATQGLAVATGCFFGVLPQVWMAQGERAAVQVAQSLAGWFPRVYVELQNHGIDQAENRPDGPDVTDDEVEQGMWDVAQSAGLPVIITSETATTSRRASAGCTTGSSGWSAGPTTSTTRCSPVAGTT